MSEGKGTLTVRLTDREAAHIDAIEREINRFIVLRHDKRAATEGERRVEETWQEQERKAREEQRRLNRAKWAIYHRSQADRLRRTLEPLAAFHEARARLLEQPGIEER
jgi:hypothetical protein